MNLKIKILKLLNESEEENLFKPRKVEERLNAMPFTEQLLHKLVNELKKYFKKEKYIDIQILNDSESGEPYIYLELGSSNRSIAYYFELIKRGNYILKATWSNNERAIKLLKSD